MFGYVRPMDCELRIKDKALYDAFYCGLCRSLHANYGVAARTLLSYDCTFIALLVASPEEQELPVPHRCAVKGFKKKPSMPESDALKFAAALNVLLSWYKLADDYRDEKRVSARMGALPLSGAFKKASALYPASAEAIASGLGELHEIERADGAGIDPPADAFARMIKGCLADAPLSAENKLIVGEIAFHLGRWIYLADAWDDRRKDEKSGSFNPFNNACADAQRARFLMYLSLNEAAKAYDLLDARANRAVLDNIIRLGCFHRTEQLLGSFQDDATEVSA
ncbi:MAG: DUF5685 family protein [Clostridia bacterium]|nr:DUF5685 family protein [Clostridia bacterium]